jgi:hypothetical protein
MDEKCAGISGSRPLEHTLRHKQSTRSGTTEQLVSLLTLEKGAAQFSVVDAKGWLL